MASAQDLHEETVDLNGIRIPIDETVLSPTIQLQLRAGRYEGAEARRLPDIVEPGERLIELGAGIGFLTALAGRLGRAECIVAVEANPALIPLIERVHQLNGVSSVVRHGVAAVLPGAASLPFYVHKDLWASSLRPFKAKHLQQVVQAPAIALADLIGEHRATLLIVDIEVLQAWAAERPDGGSDLDELRLDGLRKLLLELKPGRFAPRQIKRIFDVVSAQGFYYDPAGSEATLILFRRLEDADGL
jgi:FkbM family methyltransferase